MLSWIFETAGKNPSFLIGGVAENFGTSYALRGAKGDRGYFIIEGDEYDTAFFDKGPKFLHYFPDAAILTSVEFDHADIYKDLDAVKTAFKRMVNLIPRRGRLIAYDANENVEECVAKAFCTVERYGFSERADWRVTDLRFEPSRTTWRVEYKGQKIADFEFPLAGEYNVLNATAAAALAHGYGLDTKKIVEAIASFRSVKRRLEVRAVVDGVTIIDDFAHHPTAIAQTLKAVRARYDGQRVWAILEPRSNTLRRNVFQKELVDSLSIADEAIVTSIFKPEAIPANERLHVSDVIESLMAIGKPAREYADADAIVEGIAPELRSGDVVCILSNGGFGNIYEKLPRRIEQLRAAVK